MSYEKVGEKIVLSRVHYFSQYAPNRDFAKFFTVWSECSYAVPMLSFYFQIFHNQRHIFRRLH